MEIARFRWKQGLKWCAFVLAVLLPVIVVRTAFFEEISTSAWIWMGVTMYAVAFILRAVGPWVAGGAPVLLGWMGEGLYLVVFVAAVLAASSDAAEIREDGWASQLASIAAFAALFFFIGGLVKSGRKGAAHDQHQPRTKP